MTETPPPGERLVHGLRWGIKTTFIEYLRRMPDGRGSVGDGAVPVGTNEIFFEFDPTVEPEVEPGQTAWAFRGDVRFTGHYGMLFVRIAQPWLVVDSGSATLTIIGPDDIRVPLVTASLESGGGRSETAIWISSDVRLTAAGVPLFNDVYQEGEPFDHLVVQVPG